MKRFIYILIISGLFMGCCDDDEIETNNCFDEFEVDLSEDCDSFESEDCEIIYVGEKLLSEQSKNHFSDFCFQENEEMIFQNSISDEIRFSIDNKRILRFKDIKSLPDTTQCMTYCMNREKAAISFSFDSIVLFINLETEFSDDYISSEDIENAFQTSIKIHQTKPTNSGTLSRVILNFDYLDHREEEIPYDPDLLKFHPSIDLNGKMYSNIITSFQHYDTYIQPYFSVEEGFIGFKDPSNMIWTRK